MAEISLLAWSKKFNVVYSQAQKMIQRGQITTNKVGNRVLIDEFQSPPIEAKIQCRVCGASISQITSSHLRPHGYTIESYKSEFPNALIVSETVSNAISNTFSGIAKSEDHKANISKGRTGIIPKNHPRFIVGAYKDSAETLEKKRLAHLGLTHTEETKMKIGAGNRGKKLTPEHIANLRASFAAYTELYGGAFQGRKHSEETRALMSEKALIREAAYSPEQRLEINKARGDANRGKIRSDTQKQTYREARIKWMNENPLKVKNTTGERTIAAWLSDHRINYWMQYVIEGVHHPFDFFLPDHNTIIEFDGAHHWLRRWWNVAGTTLEQQAEYLRLQMQKDAMENLMAGLSGYRIIRVCGIADAGDAPEFGSLEHQLKIQGFDMPF